MQHPLRNFFSLLHKLLIIIFLACFTSPALAQRSTTYREDYDPQVHGANPKIWGMASDSRGTLYMANNDGVLVFDGSRWLLVGANKGLRAITVDAKDRVYAGGKLEIGRLELGANNRWQYRSFYEYLSKTDRIFNEVRRVHADTAGAYFITDAGVLWATIAGEMPGVRMLKLGAPIQGSGEANGNIYINIEGKGLHTLRNGKTTQVPGGEAFGEGTLVAMASLPGNRALCLDDQDKFYILASTGGLTPFPAKEAEAFCAKYQGYEMAALQGGSVAVGTLSGGVVVMGSDGKLLHTYNKRSGAADDVVYALHVDPTNGLWVGHSRGLSRYMPEAPIGVQGADHGLIGTINDIKRINGSLHVATVQGVFQQKGNAFVPIPGLVSECWQLQETQGRVLIAANEGLFELAGGRAVQVAAEPNVFLLSPAAAGAAGWLACDAGLKPIVFKGKKLELGEAVRLTTQGSVEISSLSVTANGALLVATVSNGCFILSDLLGQPTALGADKGIPTNNVSALALGDGILFSSAHGLAFAKSTGSNAEPLNLPELANSKSITLLSATANKALLGTDRGLRVLVLDGGQLQLEHQHWAYMVKRKPGAALITENSLYVGVQDQLFQFANKQNQRIIYDNGLALRGISAGDSMLVPPMHRIDLITYSYAWPETATTFDASLRSLRIDYSLASMDAAAGNEYQTRILEQDTAWSAWTYSASYLASVQPGSYTFQVRARDAYGNQTRPTTFNFAIDKPWYLRTWAFALFALTAIGLFYVSAKIYSSRLERKNHELELVVHERTREIHEKKEQIEAQVVELNEKNDKLDTALSELKETQNQLIQQEKMASLGQLVAGVAHEINTPVGVGVTAASNLELKTKELSDLVKSGQMKKSDFERYLNTAADSSTIILKNLHRAADLIQSFKKVAVDQSADEVRQVKLGAYLNEVLMSLSPQIKRTQVQFEVSGADDVMVKTSVSSLSQLTINMVMNAIHHAFATDQAGAVKIHFERQNDKVILSYTDNGKGIPADVLPKIFDPFFTTNRAKGGSGLGLHIVYNLVKINMRGNIQAISELGKGTSFVVEFPVSL